MVSLMMLNGQFEVPSQRAHCTLLKRVPLVPFGATTTAAYVPLDDDGREEAQA